MKWLIECIGDYANILVEEPGIPIEDLEPVGLGLPLGLAERIVRMHNEVLNEIITSEGNKK